jgi:hypothetical protein
VSYHVGDDFGDEPQSVVAADLNGDGVLDLVTGNRGFQADLGGVSVLLGVPGGSFQPSHDYTAGNYPDSVAVADLNADGRPDVIAATEQNGVGVLLGNGDGTLQAVKKYKSGVLSVDVAVGDFNADGRPDVATADAGGGTASVLLGNGDGTLGPAASYPVGTDPYAVAVADFDGDGRADLVATPFQNSAITFLRGNGDGTFQNAVSYAAGQAPADVAVADFDGDGRPDLAVANDLTSGPGTVSILHNTGGSFSPPVAVVVGQLPTFVTAADLNLDGRVDLIVGGYLEVHVLRGVGNGTFQAASTVEAGLAPTAVAAADFNGDGRPDLAVADDGIAVITGKGEGTFATAPAYGVGASPPAVVVGDFNRDGTLDLAAPHATGPNGRVRILLGTGTGKFRLSRDIPVGKGPTAAVAADLNGDSAPDLAVANGSDDTVSVLLNNGGGFFFAPQTFAAGTRPVSLAAADFDGDGVPDLAVVNGVVGTGTIRVLLGHGDGTFGPAQVYTVGKEPTSVATADLNGDGRPDLAVANADSGSFQKSTVSVLLNQGGGTFGAAVGYAVGLDPQAVVAGDFNGDGRPDLAVANKDLEGPGPISVLLGKGDGTFQPALSWDSGGGPVALAVADFDRDGRLDLAVANGGRSVASVMRGNGDGTFDSPKSHVGGLSTVGLVAGDFTGDGFPDLAVANEQSGTVSVLVNAAGGAAPATGQDATARLATAADLRPKETAWPAGDRVPGPKAGSARIVPAPGHRPAPATARAGFRRAVHRGDRAVWWATWSAGLELGAALAPSS